MFFIATQVFGEVVVPDGYRDAEAAVQKAAEDTQKATEDIAKANIAIQKAASEVVWMETIQQYSGEVPPNGNLILPVSGTIISYSFHAEGNGSSSSSGTQIKNIPVVAGQPIRTPLPRECKGYRDKCIVTSVSWATVYYSLSIKVKSEDKVAMEKAQKNAQESMQKAQEDMQNAQAAMQKAQEGLKAFQVAKPQSITITRGELTNKNTQHFIATGTYSDGSTQDITGLVRWSSSNTAVATFNDPAKPGMATTQELGSTNIIATLEGTTSPNYLLIMTSCNCLDYNDNPFLGPNMATMNDCWTHCCVNGDGKYYGAKFGKHDNLCRP